MRARARIAHKFATTLARRLFLDRQLAFWLGELRPTWSRSEIRARVATVREETPDARTFVLEPNHAWPGHRAGQHTTVEIEIDGVRVRRPYSLSSAPGDRRPAITVKRVPDGRVSGWLHDHLERGAVIRLGAPAGEFVVPEPTPPRLLFVSGGSGITPVLSMVRDLAARSEIGDIVFMHHARSRRDVIALADLATLRARHRGFRLLLCLDDEPSRSRRGFDAAELRALVPDFAERESFLCGPPGYMAAAEALWGEAGASERLRRERFVAAPLAPRPADGAAAVDIRLRSGRTIAATQSATLLEQLEGAGERPPSGCRMGICRSCVCRKTSGTVEDLLTGAVSAAPDEDIQLCISVPRSDVELGL